MNRFVVLCSIVVVVLLTGCARLEFGSVNEDGTMNKEKGLTYYEGKPYLLIFVNKDCALTATPLMLPAAKHYVRLAPGLGSADLSVTLENGMITKVGQNTDSKLSDTLSSLPSVATAVAAAAAAFKAPTVVIPGVTSEKAQMICPQAVLFPITSAGPDFSQPLKVPVEALVEVKTPDKNAGSASDNSPQPKAMPARE